MLPATHADFLDALWQGEIELTPDGIAVIWASPPGVILTTKVQLLGYKYKWYNCDIGIRRQAQGHALQQQEVGDHSSY